MKNNNLQMIFHKVFPSSKLSYLDMVMDGRLKHTYRESNEKCNKASKLVNVHRYHSMEPVI